MYFITLAFHSRSYLIVLIFPVAISPAFVLSGLLVLRHSPSIYAGPTGESVSLNDLSPTEPAPLEERQVLVGIVIGAFGVGVATGRIAQALRSSGATTPGFNIGPGSSCFKSGSWSYQSAVNAVTSYACQSLSSRAFDFMKNNNRAQMNPNIVVPILPNGSYLTNEVGYRQQFTFGLLDENGERGAPFTTQSACETAIAAILYDCSGSNSDTRGGGYSYGHDGVVTYILDPTCVDR